MKKYRYLILILSILIMAALTYALGKPILEFMNDPASFKDWVNSHGIWGPIIFMGLNIVQVLLAIIPGGPFEIGAGLAFGVVKGTLLCDIAMSLGGIITFLFVRKFGIKFVELFTTREKIESVKFLKANKKSESLLFLFFLLPGTPKDLFIYIGALLPINPWKFIIISTFARFPSIISSTIAGANLVQGNWLMIVAVYAITFTITGVLVYIFNKNNFNV